MITVQELLNQGSLQNAPGSEPSITEISQDNQRSQTPDTSQKSDASRKRERSTTRQPFSVRRRWMNIRQALGGGSLILGYACLGWTLQLSQAPPLLWVAAVGIASVWGIRRSRSWHGLLPAMISALVLVGVMLPTWVMGLLLLPVMAFFGCVVLMKGQTFTTALLSSLAVYSLTVTAASLGAIALSLMGTEFTTVVAHVGRIAAGFLLLSLFPWLHRRRQNPTQRTHPWQRVLVKAGVNQGWFVGWAAVGLALGMWLSRMDWTAILAFGG